MTHYRRALMPGGTFLLTAVTLARRAILATADSLRLRG